MMPGEPSTGWNWGGDPRPVAALARYTARKEGRMMPGEPSTGWNWGGDRRPVAALDRYTATKAEEKTKRQPATRSPVELCTLFTEVRIVTANIARSVERSFRDV
jgi:hypothetical protein